VHGIRLGLEIPSQLLFHAETIEPGILHMLFLSALEKAPGQLDGMRIAKINVLSIRMVQQKFLAQVQ